MVASVKRENKAMMGFPKSGHWVSFIILCALGLKESLCF